MGRLAWIIWVGPVQSQGLLKMDKGGGRVTQSDVTAQEGRGMRREEGSTHHCGFEDEGCLEPGNAGSLRKVGRARKWIIPWSLQKGTCPANPSIKPTETHLRLLMSSMRDNTFLLFYNTICGDYSSNRKWIQRPSGSGTRGTFGQESKNKNRARDEIQVSSQVNTHLGRERARGKQGAHTHTVMFRRYKNKRLMLPLPRHVMMGFQTSRRGLLRNPACSFILNQAKRVIR